jgi:RimJ/RimL family protein N-acetyltransferase
MIDTKKRSPLGAGDVLHGKRISVRLPRVDELSFVRTLWSDVETMAPVGGTFDFPESKERDWFARMVTPGSPRNCYCLIFNEKGNPVGEISFHRWDPETKSAELNVKVLASHRGQGYAKDAMDIFMRHFFGPVGGEVMIDDVALSNRGGQRLLSSFGFMQDENATDVCRMIMTRETYVSRYGESNQIMEGASQ